MLCLITQPATAKELERMSRIYGDYIKLAVDIERRILAGGGESHAECEVLLLEQGSRQQLIWGAGINLSSGQIEHESIINIRPREGNRTMVIQDAMLREQINEIIAELIGGFNAGR
jgi:Protein of unknown function (DUF5674)